MSLTATYPDLHGKNVFISGGATGIGASLVESFALQGANVAFVDVDTAAGEALSRSCLKRQLAVRFYRCDVTDTEQYQTVIEQCSSELGPFSTLVNNAANDQRHDLKDITTDGFDDMVGVNFKHHVFAAQSVVPMMQKLGGGSIINLGSISWMMSGGYPVYASSKAAITGFSKTLSRDVGKHRIRVNAILPGWVMTERQIELWVDETGLERLEMLQSLPGHLAPDDIANMALFLASDASKMCTGQNFIVDGGWV